MTGLYLVGGAVLAIVGTYLLIGWFLANGLRRQLLMVYPRVEESSIRVRDLSATTITLEAPQPTQDVGHPGVMGLVWDGGHGRVGDVIGARDSRVTHSFEPIEGSPPLCEGPLEGCEPVELDSFVYRSDPGDVGLDFGNVEYQSELGPMGAWLVPAGDGKRWVIMCHGWTAERRELVRMLPPFHRKGWSAMVIDYRNDPGAPPDPSGHYRFGVSEWRDVESAVRHVGALGAETVALMGCSTGGALVMSFLERSELAADIAAVVLDSPNVVLADTVRAGTGEIRASRLMREVGMWLADLRWKIDWERTNYVQRASDYLRVPTLVFHGTSDGTVPISESRQLQAAAPDLVELVETPAAGHVRSWNADPDRYEQYMELFLDRV